jgi:general secretion pathway protein M
MFATTGYESPPTAPLPMMGLAAKLGGMSPRERRMVLAAGAVLLLGILWLLAVAPALNIIAKAPEQVRVLESQLETMRQQTTEIEGLRQLPARTVPNDFAGTIQARAKASLGDTAKISGTPVLVSLTVSNANAAGLLSALQEIGEAAQAKIDTINVVKNADGSLRAEVKWVPRGQ